MLHLWDRASGTDRLAIPEAHLGPVQSLLFVDGGKTLISGSDDHTVRIWDLSPDATPPGRQRAVLRHQGWVRAMAVSPNRAWLVTGSSYPSEDKEPVRLWHLPTGKLRRSFPAPAPNNRPVGVRFSKESDAVVVCWSDGSLRIWDTLTGEERPMTQPKLVGARPRLRSNLARSALFSPDGDRMAVIGNMGGGVRVVDLDQGKVLFEVPRGQAAAFSPDGGALAVVEMPRYQVLEMADGGRRSEFAPETIVHVVDGRTGQERRRIAVAGASLVEAVAFSPDGKVLAVNRGWEQPEIHLYDAEDGRAIRTILTPARTHGSLALAFTPDGRRLVTGMSDTTILFWEVPPISRPR